MKLYSVVSRWKSGFEDAFSAFVRMCLCFVWQHLTTVDVYPCSSVKTEGNIQYSEGTRRILPLAEFI